jgi:hypothetical protein
VVVHNKAIRFKIFIPLFQLKYLHPVEELYSIKNLTFIKNENLHSLPSYFVLNFNYFIQLFFGLNRKILHSGINQVPQFDLYL